jgi:hypothetical protein
LSDEFWSAATVRVADVDTHRQAEQLAHEGSSSSGAHDLDVVVEVLPDEADHRVDSGSNARATP